MQQQKQPHTCPECGGPLKRTIGAWSRIKYWECATRGMGCFRKEADRYGQV